LDDDDVEAFNGRIRWVEAKEWFTARLFDLRSFVGCLLEGHFFCVAKLVILPPLSFLQCLFPP
jgi:hypothetical protein